MTMMACWHHFWGGPWFFLGPLFWTLLIAGTIWLVCRSRHRRRARSRLTRSESSIELLERRYAQGDLTTDEYRERRRVLEEHRSTPKGPGGQGGEAE